MYRGPQKDGKYGLIMAGEIIKIEYWTEPRDGFDRQEIYFKDKYGKAWWMYDDQVRMYSHSKRKLKRYYKKYLKD